MERAASGFEVWPAHPAAGQVAASVSTAAAATTLVPGPALTCSAFTGAGLLKVLRLTTILAVFSAATLGSRQARSIDQHANRNQRASDEALDRVAPVCGVLQFRDQLLKLLVVHRFQPLPVGATLRTAAPNRPTHGYQSA